MAVKHGSKPPGSLISFDEGFHCQICCICRYRRVHCDQIENQSNMFRDDALPIARNLSSSELFPESTPSTRENDDNNLDDVWGPAPSSSTSETFPRDANNIRNEPSDIPRLRSEHSTSGYRDGLSSAKNITIQDGFDEGYSLGAVMGLEIGTVLGLLGGIYNAVRDSGVHDSSDHKGLITLLETASRELRMEEVFGRDWWSEDGTWRYEVSGEGVEETEDFTFKEVVDSHPIIQKWKGLVNGEAKKWGLDLTVMERAEEKRLGSDDEG